MRTIMVLGFLIITKNHIIAIGHQKNSSKSPFSLSLIVTTDNL